jgi:glyoxylase-like metal-dependent hydrolase (beta-lactamase superfamily II)
MLNDSTLNGYADLMGGFAQGPEVTALPLGEAIQASGLDFAVLHTPGHSKGSVCLYLKDEGVLFSGDTLFEAGYGRVDLYGGDMRAMLNSLKSLFDLPGDTRVCPGHGGETTIARERARYRL